MEWERAPGANWPSYSHFYASFSKGLAFSAVSREERLSVIDNRLLAKVGDTGERRAKSVERDVEGNGLAIR
jgi:hypothetical protein